LSTKETPGWNYGPVPLAPGGSAVAQIRLTDVGVYPVTTCVPVSPAGIRIYAPGATTPVVLPFTTPVCSNTALSGSSGVTNVFSPTFPH
jgi:hypothetical protein